MKKTLSVFATLALLLFGVACVPQETNTSETGDKEGNTETSNAPSVTVGADNISAISVVLKGKANLTNSAASDLQVGFQYSKSAGILPSNSITIEADDSDANYNYSSCVTGLEPETTYYFRSIVRQKGKDEYGETKEFKTKDVTSVLQTLEADAVSAVSAKLQANLDLENVRCASNSFGFYWGSSSESLDSIVTAIEREDTIVVDLSALNPSKKYYFQAFASFDGKILKEAVKSFTTKSLESLLETKDASEIKATSASLNAKLDLTDVKYGSITYGFYWGSSESNQNSYMEGERLADHTFASAISNLSHKTQYWYKAYLRLDDQSFYGELKSFTTDVVPIESISLDKTTHTFHTIGSATTLTATVLPADATDKSVKWTTSDANVATVDQSGKVTAVGNGTATISVTTKDKGKSATCEIAVAQWVTSVSLNQTSTSLNEGQEQTLIPTVNPDNATDKSLKWTSSNDAIATVDKNGKVTAVSKGSATIKAEANDGSGVYASCAVVVDKIKVPQAVNMGIVVNGKYIRWASFNIGATSPEEYGIYYAWGETKSKSRFNWDTYEWGNGLSNSLTKYNTSSSYGTLDNKTELDPEDDVAHVKLGGRWRIPTDAEWAALLSQCKWTWTTQNGINGRLVTASNGNSIFLPAAGSDIGVAGSSGYYWSSSLDTTSPNYAWCLYFGEGSVLSSDDKKGMYSYLRCYGRSVRPVTE